ncbi:hypothetical protein ACGFZ3_13150 [Stenotrophomonas sp. NPDC047960]|uniref:hypothetical protein n=1 Tax=Stenotrophomonas sp. NPDC047960 TaxID=3364531 RepID=UPI003713F13F
MTFQETKGAPRAGAWVRGSSSGSNVTLDQVQLSVETNFVSGPQPIQSVHPWGFILPGEAVVYDLTILAIIQAYWVPVGTTFILRLVPDDGSTPYETRVLHVGPNPVEYFKLPSAWLMPHIGQMVYLGYQAELPDGTRIEGPGLGFQITPLLQVPEVRYEGLAPGEPLDPSKFPDGLVATVDPIPQIRPYHRAAMHFSVNGHRDGWLSTIIRRGFTLDTLTTDRPAIVKIDAAAYSGHYEDGYTDVYATATLLTVLVPQPNPHGVEPISMGRIDISPPAR